MILGIIQKRSWCYFNLLGGSKAGSIKDKFMVDFDKNFGYRYIGFVLPKNQGVNNMNSDFFIT